MAGGECHMMTGLCEVNLGGCDEDESSEPMPALTLGQGVEQNFQRVIRNSTNDKIGILSHERAGAADRPGQGDGGGQSHPDDVTRPQKAPNKANLKSEQSK